MYMIVKKPKGGSTRVLLFSVLIVCAFLINVQQTKAAWYESASGQLNWGDVAYSADGTVLYAADMGEGSGSLYKSINDGDNWTTLSGAGSQQWSAISTSADGSDVVATDGTSGYIWISHNTGSTWATTTAASSTAKNWTDVDISRDGNHIAAVESTANGIHVYYSHDSGDTWSTGNTNGGGVWQAVAISDDGDTIVAAAQSGGYISVSTDGGDTWNDGRGPTLTHWQGIEMTGNGENVVALGGYHAIYVSDNSGSNWYSTGFGASLNWRDIMGGNDGFYVAVPAAGYVYASVGGYTWNIAEGSPYGYWRAISAADDFSRVAVAQSGDNITIYSDEEDLPDLGIQIVSPEEEDTVSGIVTIEPQIASTTVPYTIGSVEFYVDDEVYYTATTTPFTADWDTLDESEGEHSLFAVLHDTEDNAATSTTITVTVDNPPAPVLIEVQSIPSRVTVANARYKFSVENEDSYEDLDYQFTVLEGGDDSEVETHVDAENHEVFFVGLRTGETYSTSFNVVYAEGHQSNSLDVGPFTVISSGSSGGGGGGRVASVTIPEDQNLIEKLRAQLAALIVQLRTLTTGAGTTTTAIRDLELNMEGTDVAQLQQILISQNIGAKAQALAKVGATGFFGSYTVDALVEYQQAKGIAPAIGYFGATTRAQMKAAGITGLWW